MAQETFPIHGTNVAPRDTSSYKEEWCRHGVKVILDSLPYQTMRGLRFALHQNQLLRGNAHICSPNKRILLWIGLNSNNC
jgi:hypothetical protein